MRYLALFMIFFFTAANAQDGVNPPLKIIVFGDSLVAAYGLAGEDAYPAKLGAKLKADGYAVDVVGAGISGETSGQGLARIQSILEQKPAIVIVEFGANDMFQRIQPAITAGNMDNMLAAFKAAGIRMLVMGMKAPANAGLEYSSRFNSLFEAIAGRHDAKLYPFFLEGVSGRPEFNLGDGVHPNAAGVDVMVENTYPMVKSLVDELQDN